MRKRLSVSSRVSWETTILSVNRVLIVLEASSLSVNPVPIVREYIRRYPCIPIILFVFRQHLLTSGGVLTTSKHSLGISVEIF